VCVSEWVTECVRVLCVFVCVFFVCLCVGGSGWLGTGEGW